MDLIDGPDLRRRLAAGAPIVLIHAATAVPFRTAHLPGAVAFSDIDQASAALRSADVIVVYGADHECEDSRSMAAELARRGFGDVAWYAGGLAEWTACGGLVE